jgi:hypothetical protein
MCSPAWSTESLLDRPRRTREADKRCSRSNGSPTWCESSYQRTSIRRLSGFHDNGQVVDAARDATLRNGRTIGARKSAATSG